MIRAHSLGEILQANSEPHALRNLSPKTSVADSALSPVTMQRLRREAMSEGVTVDQIVDRALLALADEIDAERTAKRR